MVLLLEDKLGDARLAFVHRVQLRRMVTLPSSVSKARVLLRGFDVGFASADRHPRKLGLRLDLAYGDGADEVEVIATLELADSAPTGELIQVEVHFTLIGECARSAGY